MNNIIGKYQTHAAQTDNKGEAGIVKLWLNFEITSEALEYLKA